MQNEKTEKKNNAFKIFAIITLVISILSLSVSYASLTSKLDIKVDSAQSSSEVPIKWQTIVSIDGTGYAQTGNLSIIDDGKTVTGDFGTVIAPGDKLMAKWTLINTDMYNDQNLTIAPIELKCVPSTVNGSTIEQANIVCQSLNVSLIIDGWGTVTNSTNIFTLRKGEIKNAVLTLSLSDDFNTSLSGDVIVLINKVSIN